MVRHPQADGVIKNRKLVSGYKRLPGRILNATCASIAWLITCLFRWAWIRLSSSSCARLSRLNIAKVIRPILPRPHTLRRLQRRWKELKSFSTGGDTAKSGWFPPKQKDEQSPVCGVTSTSLPLVAPIVPSKSLGIWRPRSSRTTGCRTITVCKSVRYAGVRSRRRSGCRLSFYSGIYRQIKMSASRPGVG